MQPQKQSYIQLRYFRTINGLTQGACGELLGTSRIFVSQVESGTHRLPREKLEKIINSDFCTNGLIPFYDRLKQVEQSYDISLVESKLITKEEYELIKWGEMRITESIASSIASVLPVNYTWLLDGTGEMEFFDKKTLELESKIMELNEKIDKILGYLEIKQK